MGKVLIIDDNQQLLKMHQKILSFEGFEVDTASDGEEGLEQAKTTSPSIILLDIMMPKIDGLEVLRQLKQDQKTKNIPVIVLSNLSDENNAQEAVKQGAVKYIIKGDSDPNSMAVLIREVLGEKPKNEKREVANN